jgi:hypothetical protein
MIFYIANSSRSNKHNYDVENVMKKILETSKAEKFSSIIIPVVEFYSCLKFDPLDIIKSLRDQLNFSLKIILQVENSEQKKYLENHLNL